MTSGYSDTFPHPRGCHCKRGSLYLFLDRGNNREPSQFVFSESATHSPDASEPVRDEGEGGHEEDEDRGAVLGVPIDLARDADQSEQPRGLQQSYQGRRLQEIGRITNYVGIWAVA